MTNSNMKQGSWNPVRVLQALGRIGYQPVSAVLDIADNSLSANATVIHVQIEPVLSDVRGPGRRRVSIGSFTISDNGTGMDEQRLDNALILGSSSDYYTEGTLSKFGLGLKSASMSLGKRLEIVSRHNSSLEITRKVVLDLDYVESVGDYIYSVEEPNEKDILDLEAVCQNGSGTLIRISKIHHDAMPSLSETIEKLRRRAGVVYYYYLIGYRELQKLDIFVDGIAVQARDPLFVSEVQGELDELSWDGTSVQWITKPKPILLDPTTKKYAQIEITQLPHPPSVELDGEMTRKECLDYYMIDADSYGLYIYRNFRLISWPGDIPVKLIGNRTKVSELYSFRGRILVDSDVDDLLNIDVTKNRIEFSEMASSYISREVGDAARKSRFAWNRRTDDVNHRLKSTISDEINKAIDRAEISATLDEQIEEEIAPEPEKQVLSGRRQTVINNKLANEEEIRRLSEYGERVQYVDNLPNNQLWERAHHPTHGLIVRVSQSHRFYQEIILEQMDNPGAMKAIVTIFYGLARGEFSLVYRALANAERMERVMQDFREKTGDSLSDIVKKLSESFQIDDVEE